MVSALVSGATSLGSSLQWVTKLVETLFDLYYMYKHLFYFICT